MSIEDEKKPSDRPRKKQPPKPKPASEIKGSGDLEGQVSELVTMLRGLNFPAIIAQHEDLSSRIEAAEERSKQAELRAEQAETKAIELKELSDRLWTNFSVVETYQGSFKSIEENLGSLTKSVHSVSEELKNLTTGLADQTAGHQLVLDGFNSEIARNAEQNRLTAEALTGIAASQAETASKVSDLVGHGKEVSKQLPLLLERVESLDVVLKQVDEAIKPLATRGDIHDLSEATRLRQRRTIRAALALGRSGVEKALTTVRKNQITITRQALKNAARFTNETVKAAVKDTRETSEALLGAVEGAASEIVDAKTTLRFGADSIVKAQRQLVEIGAFAENQIASSMNLVVAQTEPRIRQLFEQLADSADLKAIPALANQFELMLDAVDEQNQKLVAIGENTISSNNAMAVANRDLGNRIGEIMGVTEQLHARLSDETLEKVAKKIEAIAKGINQEFDQYKGGMTGLFTNLTGVLVNRLAGELDAFVKSNRISEVEIFAIANEISELVATRVLSAVLEDARNDM